MIRSMTGYGKAVTEQKNKIITVEIRSLNSKFFDLNLRMPSFFREKELEIRNELAKAIDRGKTDVSVSMENTGAIPDGYAINTEAALAYFASIQKLEKKLKIKSADCLGHILRMPEVVVSSRQTVNETEKQLLMQTTRKALAAFDVFRLKEGKNLEKDLTQRIHLIEALIPKIEKLEPGRVQAVRARIDAMIKENIADEGIDRNRFEQELIYYIEKLDITEEKVRLRSHCRYFVDTMQEKKENNGKKLGFISQEIGREINTIGSKANDAVMQQIVVQMKDELEKIKEQLNNIL